MEVKVWKGNRINRWLGDDLLSVEGGLHEFIEHVDHCGNDERE